MHLRACHHSRDAVTRLTDALAAPKQASMRCALRSRAMGSHDFGGPALALTIVAMPCILMKVFNRHSVLAIDAVDDSLEVDAYRI